jgi:uncharacterized metal-binding protein YceD (DUF177 family)
MPKSDHVWSAPVTIDDIPEVGRHFDLAADADARARLAKLAGLRGLPRLQANFDVSRHGNGLQVVGRVSATVGQTCVVTLEPIENAIEESVDLLFMPVADAGGKPAKARMEPPEPLVGGMVDLGAVATEFLLLGIDPFPRKAGAQSAPAQLGTRAENQANEAAAHPFAALGALKKSQKGSDG